MGEERKTYIDYVELAEACQDPLLIENHIFHSGINELPYKSAGVLKAGYDVGSPQDNGDVIIQSLANEIFKAEQSIDLEPGFHVASGANFETIIEPCNESTAGRFPIHLENFGPIYGNRIDTIDDFVLQTDMIDTLGCPLDTLIIVGLDSDTTSYTHYYWDFGNGDTSNNPIAKVLYTNPGEYTIKLAVTDSDGITDTLSKIYIVPDCNQLKVGQTITGSKTNIKIINGNRIIYVDVLSERSEITNQNLLELFDIYGRLIFRKSFSESHFECDIQHLSNGIYLINICNDKSTAQKKIFKIN